MTFKSYHQAIAHSVSTMTVRTATDLAGAAALAAFAQQAFVPIDHRTEVIGAFKTLRQTVETSTLSKANKQSVITQIAATIRAIQSQPNTLPAAPNGAGKIADPELRQSRVSATD